MFKIFIIKINMRKSDKLKNLRKINLIIENRYLESKGIVNESLDGVDETQIGFGDNHMSIKENNEKDLNKNEDALKAIIKNIADIVDPYIGLGVLDKAIANRNLGEILKAFNQRFSVNSKFKDGTGADY